MAGRLEQSWPGILRIHRRRHRRETAERRKKETRFVGSAAIPPRIQAIPFAHRLAHSAPPAPGCQIPREAAVHLPGQTPSPLKLPTWPWPSSPHGAPNLRANTLEYGKDRCLGLASRFRICRLKQAKAQPFLQSLLALDKPVPRGLGPCGESLPGKRKENGWRG